MACSPAQRFQFLHHQDSEAADPLSFCRQRRSKRRIFSGVSPGVMQQSKAARIDVGDEKPRTRVMNSASELLKFRTRLIKFGLGVDEAPDTADDVRVARR